MIDFCAMSLNKTTRLPGAAPQTLYFSCWVYVWIIEPATGRLFSLELMSADLEIAQTILKI